MSRSWTGGSTRAWRRTRRHVIDRDTARGYGCRAHEDGWCDRVPGEHTCTGTATHAHHTLGRGATGDNPDHIVGSCEPCNLHIGDPTKAADPPPRTRRQW